MVLTYCFPLYYMIWLQAVVKSFFLLLALNRITGYNKLWLPEGWILRTEFLNDTVSRPCDGAKFCWLCAKFRDLYVQARKFRISSIYTHFLIMFRGFSAIFLHKVFKSKIVTAEKINLLLECLIAKGLSYYGVGKSATRLTLSILLSKINLRTWFWL